VLVHQKKSGFKGFDRPPANDTTKVAA